MISTGRILLVALALVISNTASAQSALGSVEISAGSIHPCQTSHKARCLSVRIINHGNSVFAIPVSSFRRSVETVQDQFVRFESRKAGATSDAWVAFSEPWGDYTVFPDRVSIGPDQEGAVLVEIPGLPSDRAGHEIRIVLIDEHGTKYYSNPFDASGKPSRQKKQS